MRLLAFLALAVRFALHRRTSDVGGPGRPPDAEGRPSQQHGSINASEGVTSAQNTTAEIAQQGRPSEGISTRDVHREFRTGHVPDTGRDTDVGGDTHPAPPDVSGGVAPADRPGDVSPTDGPADDLPEWLDEEATTNVPDEWGSHNPTRKGDGIRWEDPSDSGNGIRIDRGNPHNPQLIQRVDHVIVRHRGEVIGRDGLPLPGSIKQHPELAHIPLDEWAQWSEWWRP